MRAIDLTGTVEPGMWWMGEPLDRVEFTNVGALESEGWLSHNIRMSVLSGLYLETAAHMLEGSRSIDQVTPEELVTEAVVIRVPPKGPLEPVTRAELEKAAPPIQRGDAVIVDTGWRRQWHEPNFVSESPFFEEAAMDYLLAHDISILAADMVSYDDPRAPAMVLVPKMFERDVLILSPLVNLGAIRRDRVRLLALPLKLKGLSASPCRAIALEE